MGKSKRSNKRSNKKVTKSSNLNDEVQQPQQRKLTKQEIKAITDQLPESDDKLFNMVARLAVEDTLKTMVIPPDELQYVTDMMIESCLQEINPDGSLKMNEGVPAEFLQLTNSCVRDK
jgi:hypothetical protein